jgi:hypothetical protein
MGGLAARYAINEPGPNGQNRADEVSTLVTFGTPNTGSDIARIADLGVDAASLDARGRVVRILLSACGVTTSNNVGTATGCNLFPPLSLKGEAAQGLLTGSPQLKALKPITDKVRVVAYAGDMSINIVKTGLFGINLGRLDAHIGDFLVTTGSALHEADEKKTTSCSYTLAPKQHTIEVVAAKIGQLPASDVSRDSILTDVLFANGPCFHSSLMRNVSLTADALGAVNEDIESRRTPATGADQFIGTWQRHTSALVINPDMTGSLLAGSGCCNSIKLPLTYAMDDDGVTLVGTVSGEAEYLGDSFRDVSLPPGTETRFHIERSEPNTHSPTSGPIVVEDNIFPGAVEDIVWCGDFYDGRCGA